ncbi:hypothetical protein Acr_23g0019160 [Actinidia rufa]|uniref:Uncharacterized protein n=1 Tax=Actinidia rufa TaxID=165716 RepID=A0A7J0GRY5_9ERIC|nr:hypothetical protein Acr_23g0019160 [Actinidia rufa]
MVSSETTTPTKKTNFSGLETVANERSMSQGSNSVMSIEDRPDFGCIDRGGAQTVFGESSSPGSSPSSTPDERPIIGTQGHIGVKTGRPRILAQSLPIKAYRTQPASIQRVFVK